jgi:hypothetical protein
MSSAKTRPKPTKQNQWRKAENFRATHQALMRLSPTSLKSSTRWHIRRRRQIRPLPLARTLSRHLLLMAVQASAANGSQALQVTDPNLIPLLGETLKELLFTNGTGGWERLTPSVVEDRPSLLARLSPSSSGAWAIPAPAFILLPSTAAASYPTRDY